MSICPNCGVSNDRDVCICGHLIESEEELPRGWETMKDVPVKPRTWNVRRILPYSIWLIVGVAVLGLALTDSGLRTRLFRGQYTSQHRSADVQRKLPAKITVRVTSVLDGESFAAIDSLGNELQVKLAGVDAPASGDYFADQARESLADMIGDKPVQIDALKEDERGRVLARVAVEGKNVNLEQLKGGYAWIAGNATEFLTSAELEGFRQTEVAARSNKIGLWTRWDVVVNSDAPTAATDLTQASSADGVFMNAADIPGSSPANRSSETVRTLYSGSPKVTLPNTNPFDTARPGGNHADSQADSGTAADCKPETSAVELKQPEPPRPSETRSAVQNSEVSRNYILGPRGGCFYVTASGGKKYVGRGLCGQTTAAAGRQ